MKNTYRTAAILLLILAAIMIALSLMMMAFPPGITGAGFIIIAWVFLKKANQS